MARADTILVGDHPMRTFLDAPAGGGAMPAVVVMIHGPGLDRFIEAQVEDLARHGYVAVSMDLFHRQPNDGADTMARVGLLRDDEILADLDATLRYLGGLGDVRVGPLAVLGFCMGGRNTWLAAAARPDRWKAAGVFYGGNIMKPWGSGPAPFELTDRIGCPLIGFFGKDDTNPSPADVAKLDAELTRLGKPHEFHSYEGAGHAFLNFTSPERHRPTQAADAWQKMLAFLERHLLVR